MTNPKNPNIFIFDEQPRQHSKASEIYIHVCFSYPEQGEKKDIWVPIEYRRTGVFIDPDDEEKLNKHLAFVYDQLNPEKVKKWKREQEKFWAEKNAPTTSGFFKCLSRGGWKCMNCELPKNSNPTRRIQDLKENGYTIATDTNRWCSKCKARKTHFLLLPIERADARGNGYETWSPRLRKRIINVLGSIDVYENTKSTHCLPDHKFPEIRWDENTKAENPDTMTDEEIRDKFQLMTNQRNQQKREVCRTCCQTGKRGAIFGIPFYFAGKDTWDTDIPGRGRDAEKGCIGCPWHDIGRWRMELLKKIQK